jgi:hypothetical protein
MLVMRDQTGWPFARAFAMMRSVAKDFLKRHAAMSMTTIIKKRAKETLTAVEMHHGETLRFELLDGTTREMRLKATGARICPDTLHPWCPLPRPMLRIENCYRGEDCWLGAYAGASAHGGLDINHPRGTPLWAPLDIHDHFYFNSLEMGHNNNRWRGIDRWPNGAEWILQTHHMTQLTVPQHQPLQKGQQFAVGAGVLSGAVDHSHFVFKAHDEGETMLLDPWILFWQMYRDEKV